MNNKQTRRQFFKKWLTLPLWISATRNFLSSKPFDKENKDKQKTQQPAEMIAACGLICSSCPAYLATINNDDQLRQKTAASWSKMFNADIKPEDINCLGCFSKKEPIFAHCRDCKIRECCLKKELANCAFCQDYPCQTLSDFHKLAPSAKKKLDELHTKK